MSEFEVTYDFNDIHKKWNVTGDNHLEAISNFDKLVRKGDMGIVSARMQDYSSDWEAVVSGMNEDMFGFMVCKVKRIGAKKE